MKDPKLIQEKIDAYEIELAPWNDKWKKINNGELPYLLDVVDTVTTMKTKLEAKISELKWVLSS